MARTTVKPNPNLVTAEELAARLRVSRRQVYDLAKERAIPSLKVGGSWRFDLDEVLAVVRRERLVD